MKDHEAQTTLFELKWNPIAAAIWIKQIWDQKKTT